MVSHTGNNLVVHRLQVARWKRILPTIADGLKETRNGKRQMPTRKQKISTQDADVTTACRTAAGKYLIGSQNASRALAWGARGRQFKSPRPDNFFFRSAQRLIGIPVSGL